MVQKSVICKSCGKKFLTPAADTERQEISAIDSRAKFGFICPFCLTHALYTVQDLE